MRSAANPQPFYTNCLNSILYRYTLRFSPEVHIGEGTAEVQRHIYRFLHLPVRLVDETMSEYARRCIETLRADMAGSFPPGVVRTGRVRLARAC